MRRAFAELLQNPVMSDVLPYHRHTDLTPLFYPVPELVLDVLC